MKRAQPSVGHNLGSPGGSNVEILARLKRFEDAVSAMQSRPVTPMPSSLLVSPAVSSLMPGVDEDRQQRQNC